MKKLLMIAALLLMGSGAFAQTNAVTIDNTKDPCGVNVVLLARDLPLGYPVCSIRGNNVYIAPFSTMVWPNYSVFQTLVGWTDPTIVLPPADPNFVWTDFEFQFVNCEPVTGCSDGGNYLVNSSASCEYPGGTTNPWIDPYCSGTPLTATLAPSGGGPGTNFVVTFFW